MKEEIDENKEKEVIQKHINIISFLESGLSLYSSFFCYK